MSDEPRNDTPKRPDRQKIVVRPWPTTNTRADGTRVDGAERWSKGSTTPPKE